VATPSIGVDLLVFIRESRLKGATVEVQLNDIASGECLLREVGKEQLVDDARACDPNGTFLFACGMRGDDHTAAHTLKPQQDLGAVVETAHHLAFRALLELIGRQVQTCLNARVIEQTVLFAAGDKREPSQIGKHSSVPILAVESKQGVFLWKLVPREIPADGGEALAEFCSVQPIASVPETAEPTFS
jgi:hypothetical protein